MRLGYPDAERGEQKWNVLVEALTPNVELSQNKIVEAEMLAEGLKRRFLKAAAIASAVNFSSKNPSSQPNRWKRKGQIFALHYKDVDLLPFLCTRSFRRGPAVSCDGLHLGRTRGQGRLAEGFLGESPNSYLEGRKPKAMLKSRPQHVLRAAQIEAAGVQHA